MLNDSTDNRLPERLNILIFTYLNFNLVLSIACPMSLLSLEQYCPAGFFHFATVAQNYRQIFTDYKNVYRLRDSVIVHLLRHSESAGRTAS